MEFNETWQESRYKRPLPSLCFWGRSEEQDGRPGLWLAETFWTSPLKPLNRIQWHLIGRKISTPSTKFVFFGPIGKTNWPPWPLIGWDIFDFSSETAEWNSLKLDRKQPLNAFYHVCVFQANREKTKRLPWPLIGWDIFDFSETVKGIRRNLIGSKISTPSTKFVFFKWIGKTKWPPWPMICWDIFNFSSETAEKNSTKLDRKQDLNILYQACVFSGWSGKQDSRPVLWLAETFLTSPMKPLYGIQRNLTESKFSTSSTKFVFFGLIQKTIWPIWPLIGWDIFWLFLWNRWTEFSETWQEARS